MAVGELTKGVKATTAKAAHELFRKLADGISAGEVREPRTPTKDLLAEARRLKGRTARDLRVLLSRSKFTKADALLLEAGIALFDEAATRLFEATSPNLPAATNKQRREAEALLSEVWSDLAYVADEDEDDDLKAKVGELRQGASLDDTVADLAHTLPLVSKYAKALKASGTKEASGWTKLLQGYHRALSGEQGEADIAATYDAMKDQRDRLGLVLESHLARIRRHGKKAFRGSATASYYVDTYQGSLRSRSSGAAPAGATPEAPTGNTPPAERF